MRTFLLLCTTPLILLYTVGISSILLKVSSCLVSSCFNPCDEATIYLPFLLLLSFLFYASLLFFDPFLFHFCFPDGDLKVLQFNQLHPFVFWSYSASDFPFSERYFTLYSIAGSLYFQVMDFIVVHFLSSPQLPSHYILSWLSWLLVNG